MAFVARLCAIGVLHVIVPVGAFLTPTLHPRIKLALHALALLVQISVVPAHASAIVERRVVAAQTLPVVQ